MIAADRMIRIKDSSQETTGKESKIHIKNGVLYAIEDLTGDTGRGFDAYAIIDKYLQDIKSLESVIAILKPVLSKSLEDELMKLRINKPALFRDLIKRGNANTSIVFGRFEKNQPVAIGIQFKAVFDSNSKLAIKYKQRTCPGECKAGVETFLFGQKSAINKYALEHGHNFDMLPEEAARFMVQLQVDANKPGTGSPIDVVSNESAGHQGKSQDICRGSLRQKNNHHGQCAR